MLRYKYFPGSIKHSSMIWNKSQDARRQKKDLEDIWLDLTNAYGAVLWVLTEKAMKCFHVPEKVETTVIKYNEAFRMWFSTGEYTTAWQTLQGGIPIGCTILLPLFMMAMEMFLMNTQGSVWEIEITAW